MELASSGSAFWSADRRSGSAQRPTKAPLTAPSLAHGRLLLTASEDGTARLWETGTGQPVGAPVRGEEKHIRRVAFSPDGQRFVTLGVNDCDSECEVHRVRNWQNIMRMTSNVSSTLHEMAMTAARNIRGAHPSSEEEREAEAKRLKAYEEAGAQRRKELERRLQEDEEQLEREQQEQSEYQRTFAALRQWTTSAGQPIGEPLPAGDCMLEAGVYSLDGQKIFAACGGKFVSWGVDTGPHPGNAARNERRHFLVPRRLHQCGRSVRCRWIL